jgi:hypothetical protein
MVSFGRPIADKRMPPRCLDGVRRNVKNGKERGENEEGETST